MLFGVTEAGKIRGQDISDATLREVASHIQKIEPPAVIEQTRVSVGGTQEVLILGPTHHANGPYLYDGRAYKRIGPTTSTMSRSEYEERLLARSYSQQRWENQPAEGYSMRDLDVQEISRMIKGAVDAGRLDSMLTSPREAVDRLGLRAERQILRAAVVAFGLKMLPYYPQCSLRMARFRGTTKTEFLDQRQLEGHAFFLLKEADFFIRRHLPVAGRIEPGLFDREDQPIFPPMALREALVNAFCHRDYSIPGGAVSIGIFDDRLEIASTGLLPQGITLDDLKKEHASRPRNPLLAEVFYRRGFIERWGRGTQKIVELCRAAGHPEPEFEERAGEVLVKFLPGAYFPPHHVSHNLTERQRKLLHVLRDGVKRQFHDIYQCYEKPPSERTLRDELCMLRNLGLVESGGHGAGARWWLRQGDPGA